MIRFAALVLLLACGATSPAVATGAESPQAVWSAATRATAKGDFAALYELFDPASQAVQLRGACADAAWYFVGKELGVTGNVEAELAALEPVLRRHHRDLEQARAAVIRAGGRTEELAVLSRRHRVAVDDVAERWATSPARSAELFQGLMTALGRTHGAREVRPLVDVVITGDRARGTVSGGAAPKLVTFTRFGGRWHLHTSTSIAAELDALGAP